MKFITVYGLPVSIIDPSLAPGSPTGPTGTPIDRDKNVIFMAMDQAAKVLKVGDIVFSHLHHLPAEKVSVATNCWANHVGIVVDTSGHEPVIAESAFPFSRKTELSRFIGHSKGGRIAASRLDIRLTGVQAGHIARAANARLGVFYDTGFNLHSRRQFCSRFVREILEEATGIVVGEAETFTSLLDRNPDARLAFWHIWYFGTIPWKRSTVTPASLLQSSRLLTVFDAFVR